MVQIDKDHGGNKPGKMGTEAERKNYIVAHNRVIITKNRCLAQVLKDKEGVPSVRKRKKCSFQMKLAVHRREGLREQCILRTTHDLMWRE